MNKKTLLFLCILLIFICGFNWKIWQHRTRISLEIETAAINLDDQSRPSPLVLHIYQLKSPEAFTKSDFFALYEKKELALGVDFLVKREMILQPHDNQNLLFDPLKETQTIGFFAAFRDFEQGQWKLTMQVQKRKRSKVHLYISHNRLELK
jgi:type VI secretion system protein VasD